VVEDTAQALGAAVGGKKLGTWGDMGTFSFDFYKTLTTGEGGMITTNDRGLYERAAEYSDHGHDHNPQVGRALEGRKMLGFNFRMGELQGAIGLAQLEKLPDMVDRQRQNQGLIREALESIDGITMRALPEDGRDSHTHMCFFLEDGDKARAFHQRLSEKSVAAIYFRNNLWHYLPNWEHLIEKKTAWPGPYPFAGEPYGKQMEYGSDMLPQSDAILERLVVLPISLQMSEDTIRRVVVELQATADEVC
jgi:8-amino-3,8-dideoxy-alpha-D-manno-octulosonate transaminase